MEHIFKEGSKDKVFVTLHGTGGDARDILPLGSALNDSYSILSINGDVMEHGMRRFFKRHGEGQYDVEDLKKRGTALLDFIKESSEKYDFNVEDVILIGFSNGSNIAIQVMLEEDSPIKYGVLFAPLYPVDVRDGVDFSDVKVFLSMGESDPIVPKSESENVIRLFEDRGADVTKTWVHSHQITGEALEEAKKFVAKL